MALFNSVKRVNPAQVAENLAAARSALQKAAKAQKTGFFKRSVDWEDVLGHYKTAIKHFELAGDGDHSPEHLQTLLQASAAALRIPSYHTAAKETEAAATLLRGLDAKSSARQAALKPTMPGGKDPISESRLLAESAVLYLQAGQLEKAAGVFMQAANAVVGGAEENNPEAAMRLAEDACKVFEDHPDRAHNCDGVFKGAVGLGAKLDRWDWVRRMLERQLPLCGQSREAILVPEMKKLMLSIIVIRFHLKQFKEGWEDLQRFNSPGPANFAVSEHSEDAARLFTSVHSAKDPEQALRELVARGTFVYLYAPLAGLARRLRLGPEDLLRLQDLAELSGGDLDGLGPVRRLEDLLEEDRQELELEFAADAGAGVNASGVSGAGGAGEQKQHELEDDEAWQREMEAELDRQQPQQQQQPQQNQESISAANAADDSSADAVDPAGLDDAVDAVDAEQAAKDADAQMQELDAMLAGLKTQLDTTVADPDQDSQAEPELAAQAMSPGAAGVDPDLDLEAAANGAMGAGAGVSALEQQQQQPSGQVEDEDELNLM